MVGAEVMFEPPQEPGVVMTHCDVTTHCDATTHCDVESRWKGKHHVRFVQIKGPPKEADTVAVLTCQGDLSDESFPSQLSALITGLTNTLHAGITCVVYTCVYTCVVDTKSRLVEDRGDISG